jgi:hypothetical protein
MRKFINIVIVILLVSLSVVLYIINTEEIDITGDWMIDTVEITGYPQEEEALYKMLEESLKGGKITIYEDGRIDTYSNINGEESMVTKKYDYSDKSKFCIIDDNKSTNCLMIKDWTNEKMVAETTDDGLTIKMVFVKK